MDAKIKKKFRFRVQGQCAWFVEIIEIINDSETAIDIILFGGERYNEPIVAEGAFVMNTPHEITQAYNDYYDGKYGQSLLK